MDNSFACSHPLDISRPYCALVTFEIFMMHFPLFHIGDSFEATVGVVSETTWQSDFEVIKN